MHLLKLQPHENGAVHQYAHTIFSDFILEKKRTRLSRQGLCGNITERASYVNHRTG